MCEDLLGYAMNALEPDEAALIETKLAADPELRRQLDVIRRCLKPLEADQVMIDPPADLARRVCDAVDDLRAVPVGVPAASAAADATLVGAASSWRRPDAAAVIGLSMAALVLFMPILASHRYRAQAVACREKLHVVGRAMIDYSRNHAGLFPTVAADGNFSHAGVYAVRLRDDGYLPNEREVFCPAVATKVEHLTSFPTQATLASATSREAHEQFAQLDGAFGYAMGYVENARYRPLRNLDRSHFAVLADAPHEDGIAGRNHGCGQNVWFEDGHAEFLRGCRLAALDDGIYVNHAGDVAAGIGADDVVIGAARATPRLAAVRHDP